MNPFQSHQE